METNDTGLGWQDRRYCAAFGSLHVSVACTWRIQDKACISRLISTRSLREVKLVLTVLVGRGVWLEFL